MWTGPFMAGSFIAFVCLPPACCFSPPEINFYSLGHLSKYFLPDTIFIHICFSNSIRSENFMYSNIFGGHYVTPRRWSKSPVTNEEKDDLKKTTNNLRQQLSWQQIPKLGNASFGFASSGFFTKYVYLNWLVNNGLNDRCLVIHSLMSNIWHLGSMSGGQTVWSLDI